MTRLLIAARRRQRLLAALATAVAAYFLLPPAWPATTRLLAAWDFGIALYLGLVLAMAVRSTVATLKRRSEGEYTGAAVILVLGAATTLASLAAIAAELSGIRAPDATGLFYRLALAGATIGFSWFFLHAMFAIHYAHQFYGSKAEAKALAFPGSEPPDYWEFIYFSFTIGAAAQTSDVTVVSRRMRQIVLAHTILSFFFNTGILALAINVGAGLL